MRVMKPEEVDAILSVLRQQPPDATRVNVVFHDHASMDDLRRNLRYAELQCGSIVPRMEFTFYRACVEIGAEFKYVWELQKWPDHVDGQTLNLALAVRQ